MDLIVVYLSRLQSNLVRGIVAGAATRGLTAVSFLQSHTLYWESFEAKIVLLIEPPANSTEFTQLTLRSFLRSQTSCKILYTPDRSQDSQDKTASYFLGCDMVFDNSTSILELIERLNARSGTDEVLLHPGLKYTPGSKELVSPDLTVNLTTKENLVLKLIVNTTGFVGTQQLQEVITGQVGSTVTSAAVTIHSLRRKLQALSPPVTIISRGGLGYSLKLL
jgi:DNA-binding response OmpR family regulator